MYARRWFPGVIQVVPQEVVTLTPLIYPANRFWSVGRPQLIRWCGSVPMDLTLLGSPQLHSRVVLSRRTNAGAAGGCWEYPLKVTGGSDHSFSVSSPFRTIRSGPMNL